MASPSVYYITHTTGKHLYALIMCEGYLGYHSLKIFESVVIFIKIRHFMFHYVLETAKH